MKSFELNDTRWDAEAVREHRESIIELRDAALEAGAMDWALILSVTIGLLHHLGLELTKGD